MSDTHMYGYPLEFSHTPVAVELSGGRIYIVQPSRIREAEYDPAPVEDTFHQVRQGYLTIRFSDADSTTCYDDDARRITLALQRFSAFVEYQWTNPKE